MQLLQPQESTAGGSLADKAFYSIRDMIVSLELPPGAVLHEAQLMAQLGVGRTPIREAVRMLAQAKLVEVYPRRGVFVTSVHISDLASLSEVREVLEGHAARLAAERATEDDQRELALVVRGCALGGEAGGVSLQDLADLRQAREVADVDARHEHPAAWIDLDELRLNEHPYGLADRCPSHAELLHQLRLVQDRTRRKLERDDHVPDRVVRLVREGARRRLPRAQDVHHRLSSATRAGMISCRSPITA